MPRPVITQPPARAVVLRKYPNRRLYDTTASRYASLEDVARLVESGVDVHVEDARTHADLTRAVLLQALLEQRPMRLAAFPIALLRSLLAGTAATPRSAAPAAARPTSPGSTRAHPLEHDRVPRSKRHSSRRPRTNPSDDDTQITPSPPSTMVPLD